MAEEMGMSMPKRIWARLGKENESNSWQSDPPAFPNRVLYSEYVRADFTSSIPGYTWEEVLAAIDDLEDVCATDQCGMQSIDRDLASIKVAAAMLRAVVGGGMNPNAEAGVDECAMTRSDAGSSTPAAGTPHAR